jgi:hypothetical protein
MRPALVFVMRPAATRRETVFWTIFRATRTPIAWSVSWSLLAEMGASAVMVWSTKGSSDSLRGLPSKSARPSSSVTSSAKR